TGRAFTGLNGDGFLTSAGHSNVTGWPDYSGFSNRAGGYNDNNSRCALSDRYYGGYSDNDRDAYYGFRCARTE
ncbi:MAG: hypothetical protein WC552_09815, partial [Candidatus Omnitrophota bacterium]